MTTSPRRTPSASSMPLSIPSTSRIWASPMPSRRKPADLPITPPHCSSSTSTATSIVSAPVACWKGKPAATWSSSGSWASSPLTSRPSPTFAKTTAKPSARSAALSSCSAATSTCLAASSSPSRRTPGRCRRQQVQGLQQPRPQHYPASAQAAAQGSRPEDRYLPPRSRRQR